MKEIIKITILSFVCFLYGISWVVGINHITTFSFYSDTLIYNLFTSFASAGVGGTLAIKVYPMLNEIKKIK